MFQSTRETLKRHVVEFGDQLGKENEVALIVDGQVGTYSYTTGGWVIVTRYAGSPLHRGNSEIGPEKSLLGKTQEILKCCQNERTFVCSSCKFRDSKESGYCNICSLISEFFKVRQGKHRKFANRILSWDPGYAIQEICRVLYFVYW